jgi:hypothetical protein
MHSHAEHHIAHVDSWLREAATDLAAPQLLELLQRALVAMWQGTKVTLGEVTLTAIVDRVLYTASERHPFVAIAKVEGAAVGFEVQQSGDIHNVHRLREVVRFVLVEYLTVLGNLTDEILTPALHAVLANVGRATVDPVVDVEDADEEDAR